MLVVWGLEGYIQHNSLQNKTCSSTLSQQCVRFVFVVTLNKLSLSWESFTRKPRTFHYFLVLTWLLFLFFYSFKSPAIQVEEVCVVVTRSVTTAALINSDKCSQLVFVADNYSVYPILPVYHRHHQRFYLQKWEAFLSQLQQQFSKLK